MEYSNKAYEYSREAHQKSENSSDQAGKVAPTPLVKAASGRKRSKKKGRVAV
jgi:hypothetical protein